MLPNVSEIYTPSSSRGKPIYISMLAIVVGTFAALPFISVDIIVRAVGAIRPTSEVTHIRPVSAGRVVNIFMIENQTVTKGDLLLTLESEIVREQHTYLREKLERITPLVDDATLAIARSLTIRPDQLSTSYFKEELDALRVRYHEAETHLHQVRLVYKRQKKLFDERVIAQAEFEVNQFELNKAENRLKALITDQRNEWEKELKMHKEEVAEIRSRLRQLDEEQDSYSIRSPVSGTIQQVAGVYPGSVVAANQELAQISPDTGLLVIAFIRPDDIGMLKPAMGIRIQVDAFNHFQWGMATGTILSLSSDVRLIDQQPCFEVRCSLDRNYLKLNSGFKGHFRKGMTVQVLIPVAQRKASHLLYENINDWLNPYEGGSVQHRP